MAVYQVDTLAQIQSLAPSAGDVIVASGCLASADGGEGLFTVSGSAPYGTADGGVVISIGTTGLYAIRQLHDVRPEFWGVDGTAAHDLAAFNAAQDFIVQAFGAGAISLSPKKYHAGGFAVSHDGIGIKTSGRATVIAATANSQTIIKLSASNCDWEPFTTDAGTYTGVEHFACAPLDELQTTKPVNQTNNIADILCLGGDEGLRMRCGPFVNGTASTCYWNKFRIYAQNVVRSLWRR